ncbi:tRNA preQ1(34) S-adenosylmethionine ribosyltransferase-isomerase QueA [Oceanicella actignis]|uniref:S-adenosylmethionine:tRNA ribosyltransferase-isomerase n=1 Tax=Oceanicella actignis TaxID=1189325 RepID=A0A1M7TZY3_9RHOB|nr:tRNA preQ1(34) S-adenosylmethionine ribosyltransferase-isomerase QueA [Oceanicella actignis]SET83988.1 S-adenosylmethionine:tRNA ribosyltransferase-isomerase [Oceanicella actignis]SHN76352.1 S-adenosylmethionine:tRNA ribosyltransferase-isomerase [Oceanicella actignis]
MRVDEFDFDLPEELIALRPVRPRRAARLLAARGDAIDDLRVADLPRLLRAGDVLVFNDTRVIPARLFGERRRQTADGSGVARIEATLLERAGADAWRALARPAKRLREGDEILFAGGLRARVAERGAGGEVALVFDRAGPELDAAIAAAGVMPLPPYIAARRPADAQDEEDYQTVFAARPGAVAAPTAALHFDQPLLAALDEAGVRSARVTLHVGAGTFLPVKAERVEDHRMHAEWGEISAEAAETIARARAEGGRVIAVGTTALRVLETAADEDGRLRPWSGETDIFITPGYRFRAVDGLMTNFHLPRSTLMMLVSALMGVERIRRIYAHAVAERYRFYSYGDASLLIP